MALNTLEDLLIHEMRDLLSAERQIRRALPKMARAAHSEKLKSAIETHVEETDTHIERLRQAFELMGKAARASHCEAAEGLIAEASDLLEEEGDDQVLDAALIAAAQRVEHYEMAAYGSALAFAKELRKEEIANLLKETLEEEKATDRKLTRIGENGVNRAAMSDSR